MSLLSLFEPRGIAIVGASSDPNRIGGHPVRALKASGFKGGIYPVNPNRPDVQGLRAYPSIVSIDGPCDMAVIVVPAEEVPASIEACAQKGIRYAVVLTSGFGEAGEAGRARERALARQARSLGIRMLGPNCQGVISVPSRVFAVFGSISEEVDIEAGSLSAVFQSGGFGFAAMNLAEQQGAGLRHMASTGNGADVGILELLNAYLDDAGTHAAFGYLEGMGEGRGLVELGARSLRERKPVLVWKAARSEVGSRAARSHTGNLAGSYDIFRRVALEAGLIEVGDVEEIADIAKLAATRRLPGGRGAGVLSVSGGSGIVFADAAVANGLDLPPFASETLRGLRQSIPAFGSIENPADVTAGIFNNMKLIGETIGHVLADPGVHQLAILFAALPDPAAAVAAEVIAQAQAKTAKPIHVAWCARRERAPKAYLILKQAGIAIVPTPGRLARAAAAMATFARRCREAERDGRRQHVTVKKSPPAVLPTLPPGEVTLNEAESKRLLEAFGVPVTREVLVKSGEDALAAAARLSFPLAVKIVSRDIPHKTEIGGVKLGVDSAQSLQAAIAEVLANARERAPRAVIEGVLVAEMAQGLEVLIGAVNDPSFGPCVALGLGGVFAEALRDTTHRPAPVDHVEALAMIGELKGAKLFDGWRGGEAYDKEALAAALVAVSELAAALGGRLVEMDVNPVFVGPFGQGALAADALVILKA